MYAIVDIETTGGHASANGITEVAIYFHDGKKITESFQTLINPGLRIPYYISALTGINDEMVEGAPAFPDVAARIFELLHDKIFVAHHVNFDYSFLKHHLSLAGFNLQTKKLCTVRLGRKILPGLPSYSLGKFCLSLGISNSARHRAGGDAEATAKLFSILLERDIDGFIPQALNVRSKEQSLPANLAKSEIEKLPLVPGIYYFHNQKGKVIYVGKAKNIQKRVCSHFSNNKPGKQKQEFIRDTFSVTFKPCGTELMALICEAAEIRRLWPEQNRSLKRYQHTYGLYAFEDQNGYKRLAIDKIKKSLPALYTFNYLVDGHSMLRCLINDYNLCSRLCYLQKQITCEVNMKPCSVCTGEETALAYNKRVDIAVSGLQLLLPSFIIIDEGRAENEKSCVLMEKGRLYGAGFLDEVPDTGNLQFLKEKLTPYSSNDYLRNLISNYARQFPSKTIAI